MKKAISMGFAALMFFSVLVVVDLVPLGNVGADTETNAPYDTGNGNPPGDNVLENDPGDWIISWSATPDYIEYTNTTIIVNGNLTIEPNADLRLRNVTLKMNGTSNGTVEIRVKSGGVQGGALRILDYDGVPSVVTSNIADGAHRFGFVVESGLPSAYFAMRGSELHECGWDYTGDYSDGGLWIGSENAVVENNEISDCFGGIIFNGAVNPTITGNYIQNCTMATGIVVIDTLAVSPLVIGPGNTVENCWSGIVIESSENIVSTGNTLNNNRNWGIAVTSSTDLNINNNTMTGNGIDDMTSGGLYVASLSDNIIIQDNNISYNPEYSINIENSNNIEIFRNKFNSSDIAYLDTITNLDIRSNYFCQGGVSNATTYFLAIHVTDFIFDSNHVNDNVGLGAIFNTCQVTITNSRFKNNEGGGFALQMGTYDSLVEGNIIDNNKDMGLHIVGNNITVRDNVFTNNGDGYPLMGDPFWQDCGLEAIDSYDIYIYDNLFQDNVRTLSDGHVDGIYLLGFNRVTTVYMENNTMNQNDRNLHCRGGVTAIDVNSTYILSTLPSPTPYDVYLEQSMDAYPSAPDNHITFLNTTFDNSSTLIGDVGSDHTVKWFKHIKIEDNVGSPVSGASIWINDSNGDPEPGGQPFTSDSNGWWTFIPLTEYIEDSSVRTFYTPHSIQAREGGRGASDWANMWHSHVNTLILYEEPVVSTLRTEFGPTGSVNRTYTIIIEAEGDDVTDTDDILLTPHFEFRVNATSPWVNETSSYFGVKSYQPIGGGEGIWTIEFTPPASAPISNYGFRVRFNNSNQTYSDWYVVDDMVDVLNNFPIVESIQATDSEMYRGETTDIFIDASDIEDIDEDGTWNVELQHRYNNSVVWSNSDFTSSGYDSFSGDWKFEFSPPGTRPDPNHGPVDFRARAQDSDGDWSGWYYEDDLIFLFNNLPVAENIKSGHSEIFRGESTWVFVNGSDAEESEADLQPVFYYDEPGGGINWIQDYFVGVPVYEPIFNLWRIEFSAPIDAPIGDYYFMVRITDSDGDYDELIGGLDGKVYVKSTLEPVLEDLNLGASFVYRNNTLYIFLNATDTFDNELNLTPEIQYQAPSGGWIDIPNSSMYYVDTNGNLSDDIGYWVIEFTPDLTAETGLYQFRGRVKNATGVYSNGGTYTLSVPTEAEVRNNVPVVDDIWAEAPTVTRGNSIYIYVDVNDLEDPEDELDIYLEYRAESGIWESIYLSDYQFDTFYNSWRITFSPPADVSFPIGLYDFRVNFEDNDGGKTMFTELDLVEVKNAAPTADALNVPSTSGYPLESLIITADGTDVDHGEAQLTAIFEYSVDGVNWVDYQDPGSYFDGVPTYTSGQWKITFTPPADAQSGLYSFRVQFSDGIDVSNRIELLDYYTLMAQDVMVLDLNVPPSGYRLQTVYITANGTDPGGTESGLTATFEYMEPAGSTWISQGASGSYFSGAPQYTGEYWQIAFYPPADAPLGLYSFRVQFSNSTNTSEWETELDSFTLLNNIPRVIDLSVPFSVYRLATAYIISNGSDLDDAEAELTPMFQYKGPNDSEWISQVDPGNYFSGTPQYTGVFWQIPFTPPADADLGEYSFRVRYSDYQDTGEWLDKNNSLTVINNAPEVVDLTIPTSGYRLEAIYITANGTDPDGSEHALIPSFRYKGPMDSDWISQEDSAGYFTGSPQYSNGYWVIEFLPPIDAEVGLYSFAVQFSDGMLVSQWTTELDAYTLLNHLPSAQITSPSPGEQSSASISFAALASDNEDTVLTFEWDFGDGSPVSFEESPVHNYSEEGDYVVKVKVTDQDGGTKEDSITISIPKQTLPDDEEPEFDPMIFVLSLIPIILAILVILFLLTRRRKREEEEPPLTPGTIPVSEGEPEDESSEEYIPPKEPSEEEAPSESMDEDQPPASENTRSDESIKKPSSEDLE
jgi:parallel beta-helix repeat protein